MTDRALFDFVMQIAEHLPEWSAYPDDTTRNGMLLTSDRYPSGIQVVNPHSPWGNPLAFTKIEARWERHRVGASVATGPKKVARQIERRMIAHLPEWEAEAAQEVAHAERAQDRRANVAATIVGGLDAQWYSTSRSRRWTEATATFRSTSEHIRETLSGKGNVAITPYVRTFAADEPLPPVDYTDDVSVTMSIRGLGVDQARQIADLLARTPAPQETRVG